MWIDGDMLKMDCWRTAPQDVRCHADMTVTIYASQKACCFLRGEQTPLAFLWVIPHRKFVFSQSRMCLEGHRAFKEHVPCLN